MDPSQFAPPPFDPNAKPVWNIDVARRCVKASFARRHFADGDIAKDTADQLQCAIELLQSRAQGATQAENDAQRHRQEAETANREVQALLVQLAQVREERDDAKKKVTALEVEIVKLTPKPPAADPVVTSPVAQKAKKPRKTKGGKVVPMPAPKEAAQ